MLILARQVRETLVLLLLLLLLLLELQVVVVVVVAVAVTVGVVVGGGGGLFCLLAYTYCHWFDEGAYGLKICIGVDSPSRIRKPKHVFPPPHPPRKTNMWMESHLIFS